VSGVGFRDSGFEGLGFGVLGFGVSSLRFVLGVWGLEFGVRV
jgi:hypothetical protein